MFNPRWLHGKTIARVEMNPFEKYDKENTGRAGIAHDPTIHFTDGSSICFMTEETEVGSYGTRIIYRKKP